MTGMHEWERLLGRCRRRWENNIKIGVASLEWECIDVIHLIQDTDRLQAVVNREIKFEFQTKAKNCLNGAKTLRFSRKTLLRWIVLVVPLVFIGLCRYSGLRKPFVLTLYILFINH